MVVGWEWKVGDWGRIIENGVIDVSFWLVVEGEDGVWFLKCFR